MLTDEAIISNPENEPYNHVAVPRDTKKKGHLLRTGIFIFFILSISLFLRFYNLASIHDPIFDEIYFPVFAQDYVTKTEFFDAHPPLGKLIIATGIKTYGNHPFGWRIMGAITGMLLLVALSGFAYNLTKSIRAGLLALLLVAIDPMALVESRVGLINIYLAFFTIMALWLFWRWWTHKPQKIIALILSYVFIGLATSVKWVGIGALGAIFAFLLIQKIKKTKFKFGFWHVVLLAVIPIIYLLTFIPDFLMRPDTHWWSYLSWWHQNAYEYHATLDATHPYGSKWWSWPIILRPIWLYYKSPQPGHVIGVIELGNVVTWITGLFALIIMLISAKSLVRDRNKERYLFLILTYLSLFVPWGIISRVKFIYHYFTPVLVLLVFLACIIDEKFLDKKDIRWIGWIILLFGTAFFIYFLPLLMGLTIKESTYIHHMWLKSWI